MSKTSLLISAVCVAVSCSSLGSLSPRISSACCSCPLSGAEPLGPASERLKTPPTEASMGAGDTDSGAESVRWAHGSRSSGFADDSVARAGSGVVAPLASVSLRRCAVANLSCSACRVNCSASSAAFSACSASLSACNRISCALFAAAGLAASSSASQSRTPVRVDKPARRRPAGRVTVRKHAADAQSDARRRARIACQPADRQHTSLISRGGALPGRHRKTYAESSSKIRSLANLAAARATCRLAAAARRSQARAGGRASSGRDPKSAKR